MGKLVAIILSAIFVMCCGSQVMSDAIDHRYKAGDLVPLYANKVGPFSNPSETYCYFDLPFCSPDYVKEKKETLGEVLNGDCLVNAPYKLEFRIDKDSQVACRKNLTREEVIQFRTAIKRDYYFQMYYDDLPIWGFLGRIDRLGTAVPNDRFFLFMHVHFDIFFNKDRVIEVSSHVDYTHVVDLTEDRELLVEFIYNVNWKETKIPFEKRMEKYLQSSFLPHHLDIHWSAIMNSCITVLILTGCFVTFYMRVLKKDFMERTYNEVLTDDQEEKGWKYILGDVFRYPNHRSLIAAVLGSGTQLFILTILIMILGLVGVFYPYNRGNLLMALVFIYAITSGIVGYSSTTFYHQLEGTNWVRNLLFAGCLFSGKNNQTEFQAPCHTTKCPRDIPPLRWYRGVLPQMALAGILPFAVVYTELYYIFASVWGHRIYTIYSILFVVFIILLIATALVTVALTYFQLAAEDHQWWWRSFLCGGSTGLYIFGYCFYYYYARTDMQGFLQTSFFFGYMACICYGFFLMLGTVGFIASLLFVRHIYGSIKCD
ncbi:hypothetical protein RGQ29_014857 [Quercus rubra]|uniref:Transmembrane 9 superfamily member n=1 Tax=Quercus rubra TaxID=3512 RepID=A0AAN7FNE5_QUERU|nr:hypothetical protein RGQ29_014857 [Quercus rubra]